MIDSFKKIATGLAPYVNRRAIMSRSPEARLAGRLLDADKIVRPLLGGDAEDLYISCQKEWEWNSRYWEQRALLKADSDLDTALHYARHAVAIEMHPYTLTTLGKLLLRQMERDPLGPAKAFSEAFEKLCAAIQIEGSRSRITVHPFATLFSGTAPYLEMGEVLTHSQDFTLRTHLADAKDHFGHDRMLQASLKRLESLS